jgi:hypothetical protein
VLVLGAKDEASLVSGQPFTGGRVREASGNKVAPTVSHGDCPAAVSDAANGARRIGDVACIVESWSRVALSECQAAFPPSECGHMGGPRRVSG